LIELIGANVNKFPEYSVLMSLYFKENPAWLRVSILSMLNQTVKPAEIVIVKDGPLTDALEDVLAEFSKKEPAIIRIVPLKVNVGLGLALEKGIHACSQEFIARMDTDDYSVPHRIETQFRIMQEKKVDMIGCVINEFSGDIKNVKSLRVLPETDAEIRKFGKKRTPIAHPSVIFRKSQVIACGNYEHCYLAEDFALFINLLSSGVQAYNIQEPLVYMRVSDDFYERRGGIKYMTTLLKFNWKYFRKGWFGVDDLIIRSTMNVVVSLMPNLIRDMIYKKLLRRKGQKGGGPTLEV
jgi:glycosyltransferase involved in cell wall biosynthesis